MGLIISRFRRKKTTSEVLEKLEKKIRTIEQRGQWTQLQHQRVISHTTAYSVGIYVLFCVLYYFVYTSRGNSWPQAVLYASPLLLLPVLVLMLRSSISWYYNRKLTKDRIGLNKMKEEKRKILEEVMNTETYKVAKEILDKYGDPDAASKALKPFVPTANVPGNFPTAPATPGQLRQRQVALQSGPATPANNVSVVNHTGLRSPLRPEQLPHPLVPNFQSPLDKLLNFFINDGANKRFALICSECHSHNGMVFEEQFDYTSFYCAYCRRFNASRKQRPRAPPLVASPARGKPLQLMHAPMDAQMDKGTFSSSSSDSDDDKRSGGAEAPDPPSPSVEKPTCEESPKSPEEKKQD